MILYIDETEHEDYFIVAGLLVQSERSVEMAYKRFKKAISNYPLTNKAKQSVFREFKSTLIDYRFQQIKTKMLKEINQLEGRILYSCYMKKNENMKQVLKESVYITLLANIVSSIEGQIEVVFDEFKKKDFEDRIIAAISALDNVVSIYSFDSQRKPGLQFADNICSAIRLHVTENDEKCYYEIIERMITEV